MKNLIAWLKKLIGWPEPAPAAPAVAAPAPAIPPVAAPAPAPVSTPAPVPAPPIVAPVVSAPVLTAPSAVKPGTPMTLADMIGHPAFDPADSVVLVTPSGRVRTWPKPHAELGENAWGYATRCSQTVDPTTGKPFFNPNILGVYLLGTPGGADGQAEVRAGQFHYTADRFMYGEDWSGKPAEAAKPAFDENRSWSSVSELIAGAAASSNQYAIKVGDTMVVTGFGPATPYYTWPDGSIRRQTPPQGAIPAPVAAPTPAPVPAPQDGEDVALES